MWRAGFGSRLRRSLARGLRSALSSLPYSLVRPPGPEPGAVGSGLRREFGESPHISSVDHDEDTHD